MPRGQRCLLIVLIGLPLALSPGAAADNSNAAVWYQRALEAMQRRLSTEDMNYLGDYAASSTIIPEVTPELRAIVARARNAIDLARRGSRQGYSDFGLDYDQGLELMLPHLSSLRVLEQVIRADAMVRLADGDADGAVEAIASSYRMAGHLSDDRTLISSLVGSAIFSHADGGTQFALDHAALSSEQSAALLETIRSLDAGDPFGIADAVAMEQEVMIDWLARRFEEDGGGEALAVDLLEAWVDEGQAAKFAEMDQETFGEAIDQYDRMMDDVVAAFAIEDPDAAQAMLERIDEEIAAGEHGLIGQMLGAEFLRVYGGLLRSRDAVANRAALLEKLASGAVPASSEANAVAIYLQAIEQLGNLPHLDRLRAFDAEPGSAMDEQLMTLLALAEPVIELVRAASLTKRCDFTYARFGAWPTVAQRYAPGFRDLYRLLHADARRRLRDAGDEAAGRDRLEIAYRMTAHLSLDQTLTSCLVADEGCRRTHDLVEAALQGDRLGEESQDALAVAFRRVGRADAFGYLAALKRERGRVAGTLAYLQPGDRIDPAVSARARGIVGAWGADRVLSALGVLETIVRAEPDWTPKCPEVELAALDVLAADGLAAARASASEWHVRLRQGELEWISTASAPALADVERRVEEARSVLRRGSALLRTAGTPSNPRTTARPAADPDPDTPRP